MKYPTHENLSNLIITHAHDSGTLKLITSAMTQIIIWSSIKTLHPDAIQEKGKIHLTIICYHKTKHETEILETDENIIINHSHYAIT